MPDLPLSPIKNFEAYNRNTKQQYEALGRFIVAFEAMVNEVRVCSIQLLQTEHVRSKLVDIAFHHPSLSAFPLFEIFRALIIECLGLGDVVITPKDKDVFRGVLKTIATEYNWLVSIRNSLIHGTWYIGYSTKDDPNSETFTVFKYKPTSDGLERQDVPTRAFNLLALMDRCNDTRSWIALICGCVPLPDRPHEPVAERFVFKDTNCCLNMGDDVKLETLPRKSL
jgi:hypothetical protein